MRNNLKIIFISVLYWNTETSTKYVATPLPVIQLIEDRAAVQISTSRDENYL